MPSVLQYGVGVFLALHGIVHAWYVVFSRGWMGDDEGMGWNGESWLLTGVLPRAVILDLASVLYAAVTVGFVVAGIGFVLGTGWWRPLVIVAAVLSSVVIIALWDRRREQLAAKGFLGVLINLVLLGWLLWVG